MPRVGEVDAAGWAAWETSDRKDHSHRHMLSVPKEGVTDLDPYRQWAAHESRGNHTCSLPTRSSDESQDADPYSMIMFSDIQPLLFKLQSIRGKRIFRLAWLSVLGLHIPGFSNSLSDEHNWDDRWSYSHLARTSYLEALFPGETMRQQLPTEAVAGVIVGREKDYVSGFGPVRCWGFGVFGPLDSAVEVKGLGGKNGVTGIWGKDDVNEVDEGLVRRIFAQLRMEADDTEWDVLALAFEAALSIKRYGSLVSNIRRNPHNFASALSSNLDYSCRLLVIRYRTGKRMPNLKEYGDDLMMPEKFIRLYLLLLLMGRRIMRRAHCGGIGQRWSGWPDVLIRH